jgi:hypothetical protein
MSAIRSVRRYVRRHSTDLLLGLVLLPFVLILWILVVYFFSDIMGRQ